MRILTIIIALCLSLVQSISVKASAISNNKVDSLSVSLLTCSPGTNIYELYGHTAIRISEVNGLRDKVYNFGVFSFNKPHFMARFVVGDTDYGMDEVDYADFAYAYASRDRFIEEQILNLTSAEAYSLQQYLHKYAQNPNWTYKYNFLYDNCTTRARDAVERNINGKIVYNDSLTNISYRTIIHQFTKDYPWSQFGQDILMGEDADKKIGIRQQMFAPFLLSNYWQKASIQDASGHKRVLVLAKNRCVNVDKSVVKVGIGISPLSSSFLLLLVTTVLCFVMVSCKVKYLWLYDVFLLFVYGLIGLIVAFLFLFSSHPTVNSNWLIILFNPLILIWIYFEAKHARYNSKDYVHYIVAVLMSVFVLLIPIIPQEIPSPILFLALNLLILSCTRIYLFRGGKFTLQKENK